MKMANMERLLFKGTVDEIDVGKMKEGMDVEIKVGALPKRYSSRYSSKNMAEGRKEG